MVKWGDRLPSTIDISELIENAQNAVSGKTATDALAAFTNIYSGAKVMKLKLLLKRRCESIHYSHFFQQPTCRETVVSLPNVLTTTTLMIQTRMNIKQPFGLQWSSTMMELFIVVQGDISPALEAVILQHRLREEDFVSIASGYPNLS